MGLHQINHKISVYYYNKYTIKYLNIEADLILLHFVWYYYLLMMTQ